MASIDEPVENTLEDLLSAPKFERLRQYFSNVELEDLEVFTMKDLVRMVEKKDRILMTVFINKCLLPSLKDYSPEGSSLEESSPEPSGQRARYFGGQHGTGSASALEIHPGRRTIVPVTPSHVWGSTGGYGGGNMAEAPQSSTQSFTNVDGNYHLDLSQKVIGVNFMRLNPNMIPSNQLSEFLVAHDIPKESVTSVDLSRNNLLDDDASHIAKFIETLPNCKRVNLAYNQFQRLSVDRHIRSLLLLPQIKYLLIASNPLATSERIDFFSVLTKEEHEKLIWISKEWMPAGNWKIIVKDKGMQEIVMKTHLEYYTSPV